MALSWILVLLLIAPPLVAATPTGFVGFLAIRGETVIAAENADRLFTPASLTKILTASAVLDGLGPDFRIKTEIEALGPREGHLLRGDLIVRAAGDPTWNKRFESKGKKAVDSLAEGILGAGIHRAEGDLVIDLGRFPGNAAPPSRAIAETPLGYGAPTSALAIDENTVMVEIAPGKAEGAPALARFLGKSFGILLDNRMTTVGRVRHEKGTVELQPAFDGSKIVLRGEYPISEPAYTLPISLPDPEAAAALELRAALGRAKIKIDGKIVMRAERRRGTPIASLESPPLHEILPLLLRDSQNWYAEMLLRQLALQVKGEGRIDVGIELITAFLETKVGIAVGSVVLEDGSGLSPYNLVTPRALVETLRFAARQSWRSAFFESLATAGTGTLGAWPTLPAGLKAKTGTVKNALALAGVVERPNREPIVFALLLSHRPDDRAMLRREIAEKVSAWAESQ